VLDALAKAAILDMPLQPAPAHPDKARP